MTKKLQAGRLYRPIDRTRCGTFANEPKAEYVRFQKDLSHYDILNKDKEPINWCVVCLKAEDVLPVERTLDEVQEGDMLIDPDGNKRLVLGRMGRVVAVSGEDVEPGDGDFLYYSIKELAAKGFKFAEEEPADTITVGDVTYDKKEFEEATKDLKPIK